MSRFPERQYDIARIHNEHTTLPIAIPYRLDATDYVFFNYQDNFPAHEYVVVVEAPSVASPNPLDRYRTIGPLKPKVELPGVHFSKGFGSGAEIGVLPKNNPKLQGFIGTIVRGATYTIHDNAVMLTISGLRALYRTGGVI